MKPLFNTTIVALATPSGKSAIHIIRLSGAKTYEILNAICLYEVKKKSFEMQLNFIQNSKKQYIDEVMLMKYVAPKSYTGEDLVEINCHGNMIVVQMIIQLLIKNGASLAVGGDFTKRAFFQNKLDLNQAVAVNNLINASSQQAVYAAISNLKGEISHKIKNYQKQLFQLLAAFEINIDYPDELGNDDDKLIKQCQDQIQNFLPEMEKLLEQSKNEKLSNFRIVLVGRANAGKSSLMNLLLNSNRVIVSDIAGTTRDVIEVDHYIQDWLVTFIDTAGIHETKDVIESLGIRKAQEEIEKADLILHLIDMQFLNHWEDEKIKKLIKNKNNYTVYNKSDIISNQNLNGIKISCYNNDIEQLNKILIQHLEVSSKNGGLTFGLASKSGVEQLALCVKELKTLLTYLNKQKMSVDLVAEHLQIAHYYLLEILGQTEEFDLINTIFANFCIGK